MRMNSGSRYIYSRISNGNITQVQIVMAFFHPCAHNVNQASNLKVARGLGKKPKEIISRELDGHMYTGRQVVQHQSLHQRRASESKLAHDQFAIQVPLEAFSSIRTTFGANQAAHNAHIIATADIASGEESTQVSNTKVGSIHSLSMVGCTAATFD